MAEKNNHEELREVIFRLCFDRYEGTFAGGQAANNKLDLERLKNVITVRERISRQLAASVVAHEADLLVSTPRGGDWLTKDMAMLSGTQYMLLDKDQDKNFSYFPGGEARIENSRRIIIVDDLLNRRTNSNKVLALSGIAERAVAAVAIFDRNPDMKPALVLPQHALLEEYIPANLPESDPRWGYIPKMLSVPPERVAEKES